MTFTPNSTHPNFNQIAETHHENRTLITEGERTQRMSKPGNYPLHKSMKYDAEEGHHK